MNREHTAGRKKTKTGFDVIPDVRVRAVLVSIAGVDYVELICCSWVGSTHGASSEYSISECLSLGLDTMWIYSTEAPKGSAGSAAKTGRGCAYGIPRYSVTRGVLGAC